MIRFVNPKNAVTFFGNIVAVLILLEVLFALDASAKVYIDINSPGSRKLPIAIPDMIAVEGGDRLGQSVATMREVLVQDLTYSGFFDILDKKAYIEDSSLMRLTESEVNFKDWRVIGADVLIKGGVVLRGDDLIVDIRLFDVITEKTILGQRYKGKKDDIRRIMHRFANEVVELLTGEKGIFETKLLFVSESTGNKEIYLSDYDGYNVKQITQNKSINVSPIWSPDGNSIIYTSYKEGQPYLYMFELYTGKESRISSHNGINIGARWSPSGKEIALTLSKDGNPELYILNIETKEFRRLTNNFGIDVSPSWSPDGKRIAFVSDIAGNPHIYMVNLELMSFTRLTYDGRYNASPAWSPRGDKIAFAKLGENVFNIWVMNTDGTEQTQLTYDLGNCENPTWSPNGRYVAFASTKERNSAIYIIRADGGDVPKKVTRGDRVTQKNPSWSPFQK
ncbi:MAG: Tol-Pal system beta propeller repeat protein TolB [Deltaproteobacteria bacterium]|nr:Tol-Pal system beta propeller repeat protein TolB [Deltaproteobacteria bacterium]